VVEPFAERFPKRFFNAGVAEAHMIGLATGLALEGFIPFVYSIATFASMCGYEQFRNGPLLHRLPVRLVGIGGGFAYGHAGATHHGLEDLAIWRTQPGVTVAVPADSVQTCRVVRWSMTWPGPVYLRVGKADTPDVPGLKGRFTLNRPETIRQGTDVVLVTCGTIVHDVLRAADRLERAGVSAAVAVLAHLGFEAGSDLVALLRRFPFVVTVEDGYVTGGLGSLVADTVAEHALPCRLRKCGVSRLPSGHTGSETYLRAQHRLDAAGLAEAVLELLEGSLVA
jgi:transketolase